MTDTRWTWDEGKNLANKVKHGITFQTAILAFNDPMHQSFPDAYPLEQRWQTYGFIQQTLVVVVHTDPIYDGPHVVRRGRVISARKATSHERRAFEESYDA